MSTAFVTTEREENREASVSAEKESVDYRTSGSSVGKGGSPNRTKKENGGGGFAHLDRNGTFCYIVRTAAMVRGSNNCAWLMRGRKFNCGKSCVGAFWEQHSFQLKKGMKQTNPCRGFGTGVLAECRFCLACGGKAIKQRLWGKEINARKRFKLVMCELMKHRAPI